MADASRRRRGAALEGAILTAAWEELSAVGYTRLTMDGIAERAHTSKAVLYRRWPTRALLVLAAMRAQAPMLSGEVPDTGSLRGDVLALLRRVSQRLEEEIGQETIWGLMADLMADAGAFATLRRHALQVGTEAMGVLISRAQARGEVPPGPLPPRVVTLPVDLARHELLINRAPVPDAVLADIVDSVFLPLLGR